MEKNGASSIADRQRLIGLADMADRVGIAATIGHSATRGGHLSIAFKCLDKLEQPTIIRTVDRQNNGAADMKTIELGNNEQISRGLSKNANGTYTALTFADSKTFKTRAGAEKWLKVRGYNADGSRI